MSLRRRVAFELAALAVLASAYLLRFPERPMWVDVSLGILAAGIVAATPPKTREQLWPPLATARRERLRHSWRHMLTGTLAVALLFAMVGGGARRAAPLLPATMLAALVLFILWATLQQGLFQFYLLGRLHALIPAAPPAALATINGLLFGGVHLPDVELTVLTIVGGAVWSWYYLRDRCLAPIALSHAVLGTTYYYWVRGDDLVLRWFGR
jgi:membrane protease YdiL (CAAX protease family)